MADTCNSFADVPVGRIRHACGSVLPRHCHRSAFAAVVLAGSYVEAGDEGRCRVGPGDVVLHGEFDAHLDLFSSAGAEVLVLAISNRSVTAQRWRTEDADELVRLAESDPSAASARLVALMTPAAEEGGDWPDMLARDLREDSSLSLFGWAERMGLCPESVSRGFRRAYGIAPASFRANVRARKAFRLLDGDLPLAQIAAACGFADQAHMTRSVISLTGRSPGHWRQRSGLQ
jgi:AraC-like DNA-binding protein